MSNALKSIWMWTLSALLLLSCSGDNSSEQASEFVKRSMAYEKQGQFRAALIEMRNAIQSDPSNIDYIKHYAEVLITIGSPNQAEELLSAQIKDENSADHIRLVLAEAMLLQGKFVSAKHVLASWEPNDAEQETVERLTALQLYLSGDTNGALKKLREVASQPESELKTKLDLIRLLIQANELSEARSWSAQLLTQYPEEPDVLYFSARLAYLADDLAVAETQLTEALIELPETDMLLQSRLQVLELLSTVLTDMGRPTEALVYSKIIREANPDAFIAQQQYKDALNAAGQGDLASAKAAFEDILNQFPNNQQAALLLGLIHLEEGNVVEGESLLSENLDAETAPVSLIQATALAQADQGKPDAALQVLEKALLARPDDITLLSLYGVISLNNDQDVQGVQAVSKALELDPTRTRLRLLLAQYYIEVNKPDLALGHLRAAYSQEPTDWPTTGYYLSTLVAQSEKTEAQNIRDQLFKRYEKDASAQWLIAMTDYRLGNVDTALDELAQLHRQAPQNINVIVALARLYQQTEQPNNAAAMWLKALEINPGNSTFATSLVQAKARTLQPAELADWLRKESNANPQVALPLHSVLVELLVNQKDVAKAKAISASYANNEHPMARAIRANVLRGEAFLAAEKENWAESLGKIEQALVLLPGNTGLTVLASQIESRMGEFDSASARLDSLLATQPNNTRLILERAQLVVRQEGNAAALAYLKPIWQKAPNNGLSSLYFALVSNQEPDNLEFAYNQLLEAEPNNAQVLTAKANLYLTNGKTNEAIVEYQKALAANRNNVTALNNLAWLIREQQPSNALAYAKQAAELAPNSASVLDTYGWLLHLNGNSSEAAKVLDRALELAPDNEEIKAHRAQI